MVSIIFHIIYPTTISSIIFYTEPVIRYIILRVNIFLITIINNRISYVRDDRIVSDVDVLYSQIVTDLEAKMDENNSFSQQKMIELQSQTSKRDQTYDMISNVLKSLNNVLVGISNNI